jgi:hypothetical protein
MEAISPHFRRTDLAALSWKDLKNVRWIGRSLCIRTPTQISKASDVVIQKAMETIAIGLFAFRWVIK